MSGISALRLRLIEIGRRIDGWAVWPFVIISVSQILFASNNIMGRAVEGQVPPVGLSFWRWVTATTILLPFTFPWLRANYRHLFRHWRVLFGLTFCLIGMGNTMIYVAFNFTTAINGSIVATAQPAATFVISWLLFRDRATPGQWLGLLVAFVGVVIAIMHGDVAQLLTVRPNVGDLVMLVSVTGFALYTVLFRLAPKDVPPLVLLNVMQFLGIWLLLPVYIWESLTIAPMHFNLVSVGAALWAGIMVATFAMLLLNVAILRIGANKSSIFTNLRVVAVATMAILLLGETLHAYHLAAFALILAGIYLVSRAKPAPRAKAAENQAR